MSKEINKLMPDLRFPEFKNDGEWDSTPLDDLCELITKGTTPTTLGYSYTESGVNFIKIESILDGNINLQKAAFISNECNEALKRSQLNENDILFSIAGALGVVTTVNKEILPANTNQALSIVRLKNKKQKDYVKAFLKSNIITTEIEKIKAGAAQPNISLSQVANFKILIPKSPKEQQKIASCLSSLDEVIAANIQKLDLLKDHKKGLMQNLFPQEGEKVPKLRFKEFVNVGEWVESSVEKNCLVKGRIGYRGYTTEDLVAQGVGALVLGGKHIQNQLLELKDPTYLSWEKYYESPEIMVEVGDIIFSQRGTLGDCAIIDRKIGPATINPSMVLLKHISCDARFLYYILIGDSIQNEVQKNRSHGAIPMLSQKQIKEFPFLYPNNPKEQQKIASCLSALDDLIKAQTEKIEQLKLHKKGLMQGLFPKINE